MDIGAIQSTKRREKGTRGCPDYILIYSGKGKHTRVTERIELTIANTFQKGTLWSIKKHDVE